MNEFVHVEIPEEINVTRNAAQHFKMEALCHTKREDYEHNLCHSRDQSIIAEIITNKKCYQANDTYLR
jgi:hypothetical protein